MTRPECTAQIKIDNIHINFICTDKISFKKMSLFSN